MIFDPRFRELTYRAFEGKTGGWDFKNNKGSFLFWTTNSDFECVGLRPEGLELVPYQRTSSFRLPLKEQEVIEALETRKIYPGMVLAFGVLVFYAGMKPLCGYGSINYINIMKDVWARLLADEDPEESKSIKNMNIDGFVCGPILLYYRKQNGQLARAFAADIVERGGLTKAYLQKVFDMPFNKLLEPVLIDIYDSYIPAEARQKIDIDTDAIIAKQFDWV